ncbi:endonuclease/exonuclease/phosphatase family protein [Streptomyces sp. A012304]|uniref:endonuclease/exonuclease/phosphatase family protein n=1 Tax=Streptomyces sp. A012304 TaxID=375446 RepID=UPI002231D358|nr:endonuclease/exonuclease/phosphatase family protein [Streptomyces sp. A012304]GKQ39348.1 endonuclease [Streptomyces sp. A012304]
MPGTEGVTRRRGLRTVVAAAAAVPLLGTVRASAARDGILRRTAPVPPLEVMTFNLRFASTREPNSWAARRPVMRALLREAAPHVIGTQEGRLPQVRDIERDLGRHYDWIGTGRGGGDDESMAVLYDTRRLAPVEHAHFWLSDTPKVTGSNTWGAAHPRMVTWVRFRDLRARGQEFCLFNTHLDNASRYARMRSVSLITSRLAQFDPALPLLVTGDFNAVAHRDPVHGALLDAGLVDTWDTARGRGATYGTFHGYRGLTAGGDRIDWILATPGVTVLRTWMHTYAADGQYPSDHLPVQATVSLG